VFDKIVGGLPSSCCHKLDVWNEPTVGVAERVTAAEGHQTNHSMTTENEMHAAEAIRFADAKLTKVRTNPET